MNIFITSRRFFAFAFVLGLALALPHVTFAAVPTLTANQTVVNDAALTDQTDVTTPTQANVTEIKATRTITVNSVPTVPVTLTIGTCVVTITSSIGSDTDCSNNTAAIATSTDTTAAAIASRIRSFTGLSDTGHGALTIGGSSATASFTTTGAETTATAITATLSTGTDFTLTTVNTTGRVAVAQINTVTIGGTVETGDVYTMTVPAGTVSYTVLSTDLTPTAIANGIGAALVATTTYSAAAYTVSTSTNTVIFTAKTAGTGFVQSSGTTNGPAISQQVTFTPALINVYGSFDLGITINSANYSYTENTLANTLAGLVTALASDSAVNCSSDGTMITCVAKVAGTPFTYSTSITERVVATGGGGGGSTSGGSSGGSGGGHTVVTMPTTASLQTTLTSLQAQLATLMAQAAAKGVTVSGSASFSHNLTIGSTGAEVTALQNWLLAKGYSISAGATGHFGSLTRAALAKFQAANGITPASGYFGPKTRAAIH